MPPELMSFADELHVASRYVMNHPPGWCVARPAERGRAAPFRFYEIMEQQLTWAAYIFLQPLVGFHSVIWLRDGFWACPSPTEAHLEQLHQFFCDHYGFVPDDPLFFRCEQLQPKRIVLLNELASMPVGSSGISGGVIGRHPIPQQVRIRRKRIYQAASNQEQISLEERLAKRARRLTNAKKRRLL